MLLNTKGAVANNFPLIEHIFFPFTNVKLNQNVIQTKKCNELLQKNRMLKNTEFLKKKSMIESLKIENELTDVFK